jgi:putative ABC transport system permease protein
MFKNYFITAWRSLWKNKFYTVLNISGLAVGLATGIMLLLWVQNELSFDKFHRDHKTIYKLSTHFNSNGEIITWGTVPGPLAVFAKAMPAVQSIARTGSEFDQNLSDKERKKVFDGNVVAYVDTSFFSMFSFELEKGNKAGLLSYINSIVLTQTTAQKLFGSADAIGKVVGFKKDLFKVTGVLKDFPVNSSVRYDAIISMAYYAKRFTANGGNGNWKTIDEDVGNYAFETFVKLQPGANAAQAGRDLSAAFKQARNGESGATFQLQNLADMHLVSADGNVSSLRMVQIFMLVVVLLLAIASINYVNLSTARSLMRAKEIGVRKIIGASKKQLFFQFTLETLVLFAIATVVALGLIELLMPLYNSISGKTLSFSLAEPDVWIVAGIAIAGTLVASSIYPAALLSSFKPVASLKGKITPGIGIASLRRGLVVFQFSISVILLVCTIIMSNQMDYIKKKDLGYDKSYVFSVPLTQEVADHIDAVKTELKKQSGILNVSASDAYDLTSVGSSTGDLEWPAKPANSNIIITQLSPDKDFIPTMRMKFIEGENFDGTPADSSHYILNETAVKKMGLKQPYVGQQISFHSRKGTIIGVVHDFNFKSLKEEISPLIFFTFWNNKNILYIRTNAAGAQQAIAAAQQQYKKYGGDAPFTYNFLDKSFEAHYISDQRAGTLFNVFAAIAIFISCLGLFGLATYTAQVKTKEIGIRKVLGASVGGIVQLISKDFLKLVVIAIAIATPVAWWAMKKWLMSFAYQVHISWWIFALAGIIALLIALLTVSLQAIKAAIANPIKSLRTE